MTAMGILFPCLAVVYLQTCASRATHSVPNYIAPEPQSITEPYECRSDASLDFCAKDNCKMRWKPPGTHHCSTCGVCRLGFDHHCPWVRVLQPIKTLDVTHPPTDTCFFLLSFRASAGELRDHRETESFPGPAYLDVRHRAARQSARPVDPEGPRHRCAGGISRGPVGDGRLVESRVLLDFLRRPCRALGRRHPARLPRATGAAHPRA